MPTEEKSENSKGIDNKYISLADLFPLQVKNHQHEEEKSENKEDENTTSTEEDTQEESQYGYQSLLQGYRSEGPQEFVLIPEETLFDKWDSFSNAVQGVINEKTGEKKESKGQVDSKFSAIHNALKPAENYFFNNLLKFEKKEDKAIFAELFIQGDKDSISSLANQQRSRFTLFQPSEADTHKKIRKALGLELKDLDEARNQITNENSGKTIENN